MKQNSILGILLTLGLAILVPALASAETPQILDAQKSLVTWNIQTKSFANFAWVYTPFLVLPNGSIQFYTAGGGLIPGNGIHELTSNMDGATGIGDRTMIAQGPDLVEMNYFRGVRLSRSGNTLWMIAEVSRCYSGGCDLTGAVKRLAVYESIDAAQTWKYHGLMTLDGSPLEGDWMAHTGLVYNPKGESMINLVNPAKNRFVTIGTEKSIYVSCDGINYVSVPITTPFPKDRMVFASLAKTPYGFHIMTGADWTDAKGVVIVRHLFSKDLRTWHALESASVLKNPQFYKGVHLSYDEATNRLWAFSPCGSVNPCGILAWMIPQNFIP